MKVCAGCKKEKDESEFWHSVTGSDGLDYYCHECRTAACKKYQENQELLCTNCNERKQYARGLCERCYSYYRRNRRDRPKMGMTDNEVIEAVVDFLSCNYSLREVADRYGVTSPTLKSIFLGETKRYAHLQNRIPTQRLHALVNWKSKKRGAMFLPYQVVEIRKLRRSGKSLEWLGKRFRVDPTTINMIARGDTYADVGGLLTEGIPKKSRAEKMNKTAKRVLLLLGNNSHASFVEITDQLGISRGSVTYNINKLVRLGMITRQRYKHRSIRVTEKGRREIGNIRHGDD